MNQLLVNEIAKLCCGEKLILMICRLPIINERTITQKTISLYRDFYMYRKQHFGPFACQLSHKLQIDAAALLLPDRWIYLFCPCDSGGGTTDNKQIEAFVGSFVSSNSLVTCCCLFEAQNCSKCIANTCCMRLESTIANNNDKANSSKTT